MKRPSTALLAFQCYNHLKQGLFFLPLILFAYFLQGLVYPHYGLLKMNSVLYFTRATFEKYVHLTNLIIFFVAPCVVPHVSQGRVILNSRNETAATSTVVQHGEALTVECDPQYEFLASLSPVTCNNGTWTSIPKCEPAR